MPSTYAQNKKHIYKWVANNKEKYNELTKNRMVRYRLKKKVWNEVSFEFLGILYLGDSAEQK